MFSLQRLFGKEDKFFSLLDASIQEACGSVQALARFTQHPEQTRTLDDFMASKRKERAITFEITDALCTTFVTALDREDIEALSSALYRIPKTIHRIAENIIMAPNLMTGVDLSRHVSLMERGTETVVGMLRELRKGARLEQIRDFNDRLHVIENEADRYELDLYRDLYTNQKDVIRLVFLKDLFELLDQVVDRCRDSGKVILHIALKNS